MRYFRTISEHVWFSDPLHKILPFISTPELFLWGNKFPSIEHVKAYQEALKNICENSTKRTDSKYYYKHGVTPATVYDNKDNRLIVSFNQTSGDLITGDKQRENVFNRFMDDNSLGGLQWIAKWGNN